MIERSLVELIINNGFFQRKDNEEKVVAMPMGPPKLISFSKEGDFSLSGVRMWTSDEENYVPDFSDKQKEEIKKGGGLVPIGLMTRWDGKESWEILILKSHFDGKILETSPPEADSFVLSKDMNAYREGSENYYLKGIQYYRLEG
jgi:hypothetical protein